MSNQEKCISVDKVKIGTEIYFDSVEDKRVEAVPTSVLEAVKPGKKFGFGEIIKVLRMKQFDATHRCYCVLAQVRLVDTNAYEDADGNIFGNNFTPCEVVIEMNFHLHSLLATEVTMLEALTDENDNLGSLPIILLFKVELKGKVVEHRDETLTIENSVGKVTITQHTCYLASDTTDMEALTYSVNQEKVIPYHVCGCKGPKEYVKINKKFS